MTKLRPVDLPAWLVAVVLVAGWLLDKVSPLRSGPCDQGFAFLIPLIIAAVGAGASYLKSRAAGKSVQEQNQLYNDWLRNRANGVNDLIEKITQGGSSPFGPQTSTSNTRSLSSTIQNMLTQSSQKPVVTPQYQGLEASLRNIAEGRLRAPTALPPGYTSSQIRNINQTFQGATQAAKNAAARSGGLSGDAALGLAMPIESARAGKIADFLSTVPLTERDLRTQDINQAAELARTFGLGTEGTSRTSGTSSTSGSSSTSMTTPPNIGALANLILPQAPFAPTSTGMSPTGQVGGDLATILAWLWQQGAFGQRPPGSASSSAGTSFPRV